MKELIKNKYSLMLLAIVLLGFLLRVYIIDFQSIWRDEAFSINAAGESLNRIMQISSKDTQPPLHLLILAFWIRIFGDTAVSVRSLSLFFGMLLFIPAFLISKPNINSSIFKSRIAQLMLLIFIAVNPVLIAYSVEARAYSMLQFIFLFSYYFFTKILKSIEGNNLFESKKEILGFVFFSLLGLYTHNIYVLVLLGLGLIFILKYLQKYKFKITLELSREIFRNTLIIFSPIGLLYIPWFATFINQYSKVSKEGFWLTLDPVRDPFNEFARSFIGEQIPGHSFVLSLIVMIILAIGTTTFILGSYSLGLKKDNDLRRLGIIFLVIYLFSYLTSFIFIRYISFLIPIEFIVVVCGFLVVEKIDPKLFRFYLGAFLIATLLFYGFFSGYQSKYQYKEVLANIEYHQDEDLILNLDAMSFHSTRYYLGLDNKVYDPDRKISLYQGTAILQDNDYYDANISNFRRIWAISLYGNEQEEKLEAGGFRFKEEFRDRELRVQLYER